MNTLAVHHDVDAVTHVAVPEALGCDAVLDDSLAGLEAAKHWFGWCCCSLALGSAEAKTHCNSVVGVIQAQSHQEQQVTVEGARESAPPMVIP